MRVLYLTFFSSDTNDGIYESQVKGLLCKLGATYSKEIKVSHIAILPAVVVGRRDISLIFLSERRRLVASRREFQEKGVDVTFLVAPVVILKRWASHPNLLLLALISGLCMPVLIYKVARWRYDIIHCRSYLATALALATKGVFRNLKVVFDPRGFYPEEGVVHNRWNENSLSFRIWKWLEKQLIRRSDRVISLSDVFTRRVSELDQKARCSLIYAGADVQRFCRDPEVRARKQMELGLQGKTVFVYNGSLGSWHDPSLLARIYKVVGQELPSSALLIITRYNRAKLQGIFRAAGVEDKDFRIVAAKPSEVPSYLMAGDFGIVPSREKGGVGAIQVVTDTMIGLKVAEYLASGLPIIVNREVRGIRSLMMRFRIGVFFDSNKLGELPQGILYIKEHYEDYQAECERVANRFLSLDQAVRSYFQVYEEVLGGVIDRQQLSRTKLSERSQ